MTVHDIRFSDDGAGINICCTGGLVDPFLLYDPIFLRSEILNESWTGDEKTRPFYTVVYPEGV